VLKPRTAASMIVECEWLVVLQESPLKKENGVKKRGPKPPVAGAGRSWVRRHDRLTPHPNFRLSNTGEARDL
jgi:hypothetical protein